MKKTFYTLREAFDELGRALYRGAWIGEETIQAYVSHDGGETRTAEMQEVIVPVESGWTWRPPPEKAAAIIERPEHWAEPGGVKYQQQHEAWRRRVRTHNLLVEILSHTDVHTYIFDHSTGNNTTIPPGRWESPADLFNFATVDSVGELGWGANWITGEIRIDRAQLDKAMRSVKAVNVTVSLEQQLRPKRRFTALIPSAPARSTFGKTLVVS